MRLSKRQRWFWSMLAAVVILLMLGASGLPQRWLVKLAIAKGTNASRVEVRGVSLLSRARVEKLQVYPPGEGGTSATPMIDAENLKIAYNLSPMQRRHVGAVSLDKLHISYAAAQSGAVSTSVSTKGRARPDDDPDALPWYAGAWFPTSADVGRISGDVTLSSMGISVDGLALRFVSRRGERMFELQGDEVTGEWRNSIDGSRRPIHGALDVEAHGTQYGTSLDPLRIDLTGFVSAHGSARYGTEQSRTEFQVNLNDLYLGEVDLSSGSGAKSLPVAFAELQFSGIRARGSWSGLWGNLTEVELHGRAKNLRLGRPEALVYKGDLAIDVRTPPGAYSHFNTAIAFGKGQKLTADIDGAEAELQAHIAFSEWNREQWLDLIPESIRPYWALAPGIGRMSGAMEATYIVGGVYGKGTLTPTIGEGSEVQTRPMELEVVEPPFWSQEPRRIVVAMAFPDQGKQSGLRAEYTVVSETGEATAEVVLTDVQTSTLLRSLGMVNYLERCVASASGKVSLHKYQGSSQAQLELKAAPFSCPGLALPENEPLTVKAQISADASTTNAVLQKLEATIGDVGKVSVVNGRMTTAPWGFGGDATASFDLAKLGPCMGVEGVRGSVDVKAAIHCSPDATRAAVSGVAKDFAWGDLLALGETPVSLKGDIAYDASRREFSAKAAEIRFDKGTTLVMDSVTVAAETGTVNAPFTLTSDLAVLKDSGWLSAATGQAKAVGVLSRSGGASKGECAIEAQAETLTLPNAVAGFGGIGLKAHLLQEDTLSGAGELHVANVIVSGATLHDVSGSLELGKEGVNIPDLAASVFGGTVKGRLNADLLDAKRPLRFEGAVEALDLDAFTKEFKPPGAILTGIVRGDFLVELEGTKLTDLKIALHCDRGFSMNRDLVQQLLASGAMKGFTGAKTLEKVMNQIVGDAEQRPFDTVELSLKYEEDGLKGQAILHSKGLNLTIDLNVDPAALKAAIELRQQAQLGT